MPTIFEESYAFIYKRWDDIVLVVLFFLIGLIYVVLNNVSVGESDHSSRKTSKVVVVEGLESNDTTQSKKPSILVAVVEEEITKGSVAPEQSGDASATDNGASTNANQTENINTDICAKYAGKSHLQQTHCNSLADSVCRVSSCCILAHEKDLNTYTCVAGNASGAVYDESEDTKGSLVPINFDYWFYKNKCYGDKKQCAAQMQSPSALE